MSNRGIGVSHVWCNKRSDNSILLTPTLLDLLSCSELCSTVTSQWAPWLIRSLAPRLSAQSSKKTSKFRVTGLCVGKPPLIGGFPIQMVSNAENISMFRSLQGKYHRFSVRCCRHDIGFSEQRPSYADMRPGGIHQYVQGFSFSKASTRVLCMIMSNHWNRNIFIMMKFSSVVALRIVKIKKSNTVSDRNFTK